MRRYTSTRIARLKSNLTLFDILQNRSFSSAGLVLESIIIRLRRPARLRSEVFLNFGIHRIKRSPSIRNGNESASFNDRAIIIRASLNKSRIWYLSPVLRGPCDQSIIQRHVISTLPKIIARPGAHTGERSVRIRDNDSSSQKPEIPADVVQHGRAIGR